jgi:ribosome-binding protein aMBF1 (putative translation factor)
VRITEANLWDAPIPAVERLATSLGIVVNERARSAWGNEWQLTQEELARELDVTVGTLSNWENARHRPVRAQRRRIEQIAESLGLLESSLQRKAL